MEDSATLTQELSSLITEHDAKVAIDLSNLTLLDSSGLSALINIVTRARITGADVVLVSPGAFVAGVLEVTRLDTWFDICPDLADVEKRFAQA